MFWLFRGDLHRSTIKKQDDGLSIGSSEKRYGSLEELIAANKGGYFRYPCPTTALYTLNHHVVSSPVSEKIPQQHYGSASISTVARIPQQYYGGTPAPARAIKTELKTFVSGGLGSLRPSGLERSGSSGSSSVPPPLPSPSTLSSGGVIGDLPLRKSGFMRRRVMKDDGLWFPWKERWFELSGGSMKYSKSESDSEALGELVLSAGATTSISADDSDGGRACFRVAIDKQGTMGFSTPSVQEREGWIQAIKSHVTYALSRR